MGFNPNEHMMDIKGKKYMQTKWRLVWLRDEHPDWTVATDIVMTDPMVVKAIITDVDGRVIATGHGMAIDKGNAVWSGRSLEKAETAAVGRACAHAGYGTQFADEDDDEDGALADSPVERRPQQQKPATPKAANGAPPAQTGATHTWTQPEIGAFIKWLAEVKITQPQAFETLKIKGFSNCPYTPDEARQLIDGDLILPGDLSPAAADAAGLKF